MSNLERKLTAGEFVVTAELPVIDGGGHAELQRQLEPMRPFVDAFNATDNPAAHAHVSPLAVSIGLQEVGAEPIMQLVCRDRNRLALEADLMGAAMYGIENVSCLTGDDVSAGDEPEARRVFDLDSIQLVALARTLTAATTCQGARSIPSLTSSSARWRTRRRRRWSSACAAPPRRRWPARGTSSSSSATAPNCSSGSCAPPTTSASPSGSR